MRRKPLTDESVAPNLLSAVNTPSHETFGVGPIQRVALRLDEVAKVLGVSRRTVERERSAGRFPKPDKIIGRMPLWRVETIRRYTEGGGLQ